MPDSLDAARISELENQLFALQERVDRLSNLTDNPFYLGVVDISITTPVVSIKTYSN
jgi:tRNA (Thr-GGU) A37 N-methylase